MPPSDGSPNALLGEVIAEFGRHLDMLAEQLSASVAEADRECATVGDSFHQLSAARAEIEKVACPEPGRGVLRHSCRQIGESLHNAVVALQYHDRLAQRLGLVRAGLERLQTLLQEPAPRSYQVWLASLRELEHTNRIEQQRLGPVQDPSDPAAAALPQSSVELF
jgi:hypothetical protein